MTDEGPITFAQWATANETSIETRIDSLWEQITAALEAGRITEAQFRYVMDREAEWGDQGVVSRWVFSHYLGACANDPEHIAVVYSETTYPCGQCLDRVGWLPDEADDVFPCPSCNGRLYELWVGGHFRANHACSECAPSKRARGKAGASNRSELADERHVRADLEQREIESELY